MPLNNKLLISDTFAEFTGFELLQERATVCLQSGGIVIVPGWKPENVSHHYKIRLDSNRRVYDKILIDIFRKRKMLQQESFVFSENNYYIERFPHRAPQ